MIEKMQVYKCEVCGNIVDVLHAGGGTLVCCGQPMKLQDEKTADSATEKHVPLIQGRLQSDRRQHTSSDAGCSFY